MSGEFKRRDSFPADNGFSPMATNGNGKSNGDGDDDRDVSAPASPVMATTPAATAFTTAPSAPSGLSKDGLPKHVDDVIYSDIGVATLLNRLKQSIASARDFAAFLKKRSTLEEEHATGLKRLARGQLETVRRVEAKSGTYAAQVVEVMRVHERMADNGMQFALSLHQMHEDLSELSANMERGRKQWKHEGLDSEKRAADAEAAMVKAKSRYDTLAEDYDRARTGDTKSSRRIGLKGPKSAEQYEQDLLRKTQAADADYEEKVRGAKQQRESLLNEGRPRAVRALLELIRECDGALTLQLQKFATFNEKLLLGNGLAVTPLTDKEVVGGQKSLRDLIFDIDNEKDLHNNLGANFSKLPPRPTEIKYEQHPTLAPKTQQPASRNVSSTVNQPPSQPTAIASQPPTLSINTTGASSQPSSTNTQYTNTPLQQPPQQPPYGQQMPPATISGYTQSSAQVQSPSYGNPQSQQQPLPAQHQQHQQQQTSYSQATARDGYSAPPYGSAPPYPTHPSERSPAGYTPQQTTGTIAAPLQSRQFSSQTPSGDTPSSAHTPLQPVFGVSLEELFQRDQSAVPMVVIQCILAVDTFGLDVEGIYRLSGTASHVTQLKAQFDRHAAQLDFRNPANFSHDVNSVATLLKQFFRELPDPLFTRAAYSAFIEAARFDDPDQRRDALHQGINDLPDPNYATLRALVLHLHRVMQNESKNRMGSSNLAVCFAPCLMGALDGSQIANIATLHARVIDTILVNATAIFDED